MVKNVDKNIKSGTESETKGSLLFKKVTKPTSLFRKHSKVLTYFDFSESPNVGAQWKKEKFTKTLIYLFRLCFQQ
jgi:hypothetical protein